MRSYIVLGHGSEKIGGARPVVPPGCTLVLTEECGMSGTIPPHIYPILANEAHKAMFDDPVAHKAEIEEHLKRPIRIYREGKSYPTLSYTLLSSEADYSHVGPSGLFAIPTPPFVFQPREHGDKRHLLAPRDVKAAFAGAVVPAVAPAMRTLQQLERVPALRKTQAELFASHPGVHYSLLCRTIPDEDRIKDLIIQNFPELDINSIFTAEGADVFQTAAYWILTLKPDDIRPKNRRLAVATIKTIIDSVMDKRRASGSPLGEQNLMTLLAMRSPPHDTLMQTLTELRDTDRRDRRNGYTPLMLASFMGHREAVHVLLQKGADPNSRDHEGSTPLIFACTSGNLPICSELLTTGADPRIASDDGTTPLLIACSKRSLQELIPAFIERGADTMARDDEGDTPLHVAASNGMHELIPVLISAGANPNSQNVEGKTPLMLAIEDKEVATAAALLPVSDVTIRTSTGVSALDMAAKGLPQLAALIKRRASSSERRRRSRRNGTNKGVVAHRRTSKSSSHH